MPKPQNRFSFIVLFIGVVAVSTAAIFIRLTQAENIRSIDIATYRLLLSAILLSPVILLRYRLQLLKIPFRILIWCILAGFLLAIHFAAWITSLEYTSIASSVVLVTTTPIWVGLYSVIFQKESFTRSLLAGLALALIGGFIVAMSEECRISTVGFACNAPGAIPGTALIGNGLALVGAWMAAGYLLIGKRVQKTVATTPYIFVVYGTAAMFLVLFSLFSGPGLLAIPTSAMVWLICLAVIPQLVGHTIFNWSLKHFSATYVSIALLGEPIGSTILGYFLFKEAPSIVKIGGALVILIGILVVSINQGKSPETSTYGVDSLP